MKSQVLSLLIAVFFSSVLYGQNYFNYAAGKPVKTSVNLSTASRITDESLLTGSWRCDAKEREQWVEIDLTAEFTLAGAHIYFDEGNVMPLNSFVLQYKRGGEWIDIPGTENRNNFNIKIFSLFSEQIKASSVRLKTVNKESFGIVEIQLWGEDVPSTPLGVQQKKVEPFVTDTHWVCVNQVAYNSDAPKRFTVPTEGGAKLKFELIESLTNKVVFKGTVNKGIGDFTAYHPKNTLEKEFYIKVKGGKLKDGTSFPFSIGRQAIQEMSYRPAVYFMNDARSVIGTHNSAYGGCPWRDGTYYTYEVPSMVLLYLSNPEYFKKMQVTLNWQEEKEKILDPRFDIVREAVDRDALLTAQNYYTLLPKPRRTDIPDIIQNIRFGIGWMILDPITADPSGDPAGERMHSQTVEQLAYFLYAYPMLKEYIEDDFYQLVLQSALRWWKKVGLLQVITEIGTGKGRQVPGHSIMPNLMMYEVAKRENLPVAEQFMKAAVAQTQWIIETLDWNDPTHTKGQRMSEHKLITGLVHFYLNYPNQAPAGLQDKLETLTVDIIRKSDNLWDFRRFDLGENWTLPGFNEAGNIAGFPACALGLAMVLDTKENAEMKQRLVEIGYAHFDNLYGRNPLNAHAANHPKQGFEGVDYGWPYRYGDNICARLELTRGSISSLPGSEMYPFNPKGKYRHPEGWTSYNAAWNVSLAFLNFFEGVSSICILKSCQ